MRPLTSPKRIHDIMKAHGFRFSKNWGQNFLIDQNIVNKIIEGAQVNKEDNILEIGPGIGTMTHALAQKSKQVVAVEIDKSLLPILSETLADFSNVHIVQGDILKIDVNYLIDKFFIEGPPKVVANLPYYVTTPIIMHFLEEDISVKSLVVMVQKEVAERLVAVSGTKAYGVLSIMAQYRADIEIFMDVPPTAFMPQPKVVSSVVCMRKKSQTNFGNIDENIFFKTVRSAFMKRRKTLRNALSSGILPIDKTEVNEALERAEIDGGRRGETLEISDFVRISAEIKSIIEKR